VGKGSLGRLGEILERGGEICRMVVRVLNVVVSGRVWVEGSRRRERRKEKEIGTNSFTLRFEISVLFFYSLEIKKKMGFAPAGWGS
jgi:hypothetical protein